MSKGSIRYAPWPDGRAFRVRTTGAPGKWNCVSVRWQEGPLKGRDATLDSRTLRASRRAAIVDEWEELL